MKPNGKLRFHRVNAPTASELNTLAATICHDFNYDNKAKFNLEDMA